MKRLFSIFMVLGLCLTAYSQNQPQRSPEEEARTRTERLCRELSITDSVQRHQLYAMHLKYARQRQVSNTRQEMMKRMLEIDAELKTLLTAEQYKRFMNHQINPDPRLPQHPFEGMQQKSQYAPKTGTSHRHKDFLPTDPL